MFQSHKPIRLGVNYIVIGIANYKSNSGIGIGALFLKVIGIGFGENVNSIFNYFLITFNDFFIIFLLFVITFSIIT